MKPLNPDCPLALQLLHRRSAACCAIFLKSIRAASCAPTCFAVLLLAFIPAANADSLGRLFFSPEQRAQLDYAYARHAPAEGSSSPYLTVNGIVQKQGGPRTVWINGVAQSAGNSNESAPTAQTVSVPGKSHPVKIKVGQKILLDQPPPTNQDAPGE